MNNIFKALKIKRQNVDNSAKNTLWYKPGNKTAIPFDREIEDILNRAEKEIKQEIETVEDDIIFPNIGSISKIKYDLQEPSTFPEIKQHSFWEELILVIAAAATPVVAAKAWEWWADENTTVTHNSFFD